MVLQKQPNRQTNRHIKQTGKQSNQKQTNTENKQGMEYQYMITEKQPVRQTNINKNRNKWTNKQTNKNKQSTEK